MMVLVDVRVESHGSAVAMHELHFAHFLQFVKRLIHGSQRDAGHALAGFVKEGVSGWMRDVVVHQAEQQLTLRRESAALLAVLGGDDVWCVHGLQGIRRPCLFASRAK